MMGKSSISASESEYRRAYLRSFDAFHLTSGGPFRLPLPLLTEVRGVPIDVWTPDTGLTCCIGVSLSNALAATAGLRMGRPRGGSKRFKGVGGSSSRTRE